jgi:hypothetical protein
VRRLETSIVNLRSVRVRIIPCSRPSACRARLERSWCSAQSGDGGIEFSAAPTAGCRPTSRPPRPEGEEPVAGQRGALPRPSRAHRGSMHIPRPPGVQSPFRAVNVYVTRPSPPARPRVPTPTRVPRPRRAPRHESLPLTMARNRVRACPSNDSCSGPATRDRHRRSSPTRAARSAWAARCCPSREAERLVRDDVVPGNVAQAFDAAVQRGRRRSSRP